MGVYHVNEDLPNNRAVVHEEPCGHAIARDKKPGTGEWHENIESFEAACSVAQSLGRREVTWHQTSRCVKDPRPFET